METNVLRAQAAAQDTEGQWDKWLVADVVCHEVAHQWFGNLVTCATWQDITVNEARDALFDVLYFACFPWLCTYRMTSTGYPHDAALEAAQGYV